MKKILIPFSITLILVALSFTGCARDHTAISSDGVSIIYQVKGIGKPALVFIHGGGGNRSHWDRQVAHFVEQHKVVTIDLAGHGDSGFDRAAWTMSAFGEDVVAVVDKLGLDQIVLIGHSMGGAVILETARRMPQHVIGLVGIDNFKNVERSLTQEQIDKILAPFRANFSVATSNVIRRLFTSTADSSLIKKILADISAIHTEGLLAALEEFYKYDFTQALHEVRAPIRCINSDKSHSDVEAGQRHTLSFKVVLMSGVGHFVMMEDPETFNRLLEEIVNEFEKEPRSQTKNKSY